MKRLLVGAVLALGLAGCGADACAKGEECAKKAGTTFSITECRNSLQTAQEQASTAGCGAEYNDYENCIGALTCDQLTSVNGISANCGAKSDKLTKCLQ